MALNPYTLYNLYEKGILDYVPADLTGGTPMGSMMQASNPYLDMAMQGGLYQNHGTCSDAFSYTGNGQSYGNGYSQLGAFSNAGGMNAFNGYGVGGKTNVNGMNIINGYGVGTQSPAGFTNAAGGFSDVTNGINSGLNKTASVIDRTPKFLLGLAAGVIGFIGIKALFRRGKKPSNAGGNNSLFSKLNPMNWFRKKK